MADDRSLCDSRTSYSSAGENDEDFNDIIEKQKAWAGKHLKNHLGQNAVIAAPPTVKLAQALSVHYQYGSDWVSPPNTKKHSLDPWSSGEAAYNITEPINIRLGKAQLHNLSTGNYKIPALMAQASAGSVKHQGHTACNRCQKGNGPFDDCVTALGLYGEPMFEGACANCSWNNGIVNCSFSRKFKDESATVTAGNKPNAEKVVEASASKHQRGAYQTNLSFPPSRHGPKLINPSAKLERQTVCKISTESAPHPDSEREIVHVEIYHIRDADSRKRKAKRISGLQTALQVLETGDVSDSESVDASYHQVNKAKNRESTPQDGRLSRERSGSETPPPGVGIQHKLGSSRESPIINEIRLHEISRAEANRPSSSKRHRFY